MLHILSKTTDNGSLQRIINLMLYEKNSELLLYQDAVYMAIDTTEYSKIIKQLSKNHKIYILEDDIIARGLKNKIITEALTINYEAFVKLTVQHDKTISW